MIKVNIEVLSWLKDDFDDKGSGSLTLEEVISPGTAIMDLVHLMANKYPKFGKKALDDQKQELIDYCAVTLNGRFVSSPAELNMELKEGDTVTLFPAFAGG